MEDVLNQHLEELPHNRHDIVSKHIFGTFTEDLLRALTKIPQNFRRIYCYGNGF